MRISSEGSQSAGRPAPAGADRQISPWEGLPEDEVHVWSGSLDAVAPQLSAISHFLTEAEQDRAARAGRALPSIVGGTGVQRTRRVVAGIERGVLHERGMFSSIEPHGVRWPDGSYTRADAIIWATGFRPELRHLAPLGLREREGGVAVEDGASLTDPRVFFAGYGPTASIRWRSGSACWPVTTAPTGPGRTGFCRTPRPDCGAGGLPRSAVGPIPVMCWPRSARPWPGIWILRRQSGYWIAGRRTNRSTARWSLTPRTLCWVSR